MRVFLFCPTFVCALFCLWTTAQSEDKLSAR